MGRIFRPLSGNATLPKFDIEMSRPDMVQALDYVSGKLSRKGHHLTLIVTGAALSCLELKTLDYASNISIVPGSPLEPPAMDCLAKAARKASKKFHLGADWLHNRDQVKLTRLSYLSDVVHSSLLQNEVVYSSEGLSLLAIDYTWALKSKLEELSMNTATSPSPQNTALDDAVALLHRLVRSYRGRPLTKGYLSRCYPLLETTDAVLLHLNSVYEWRHKRRGLSGINDEWLEWRREGRVELEIDIEAWGLDLIRDGAIVQDISYDFDSDPGTTSSGTPSDFYSRPASPITYWNDKESSGGETDFELDDDEPGHSTGLGLEVADMGDVVWALGEEHAIQETPVENIFGIDTYGVGFRGSFKNKSNPRPRGGMRSALGVQRFLDVFNA